MPEDYVQSAIRHWEDACHLADGSRYDNASHLVGFALECALKQQMQIAGAAAAKVHIPELFAAYRALMKGRQAKYVVDVAALSSGLESFANWSVNDRYQGNGFITEATWSARKQKTGKFFAAVGIRKTK